MFSIKKRWIIVGPFDIYIYIYISQPRSPTRREEDVAHLSLETEFVGICFLVERKDAVCFLQKHALLYTRFELACFVFVHYYPMKYYFIVFSWPFSTFHDGHSFFASKTPHKLSTSRAWFRSMGDLGRPNCAYSYGL